MTKIFNVLCGLLLVIVMLTACKKNNDEDTVLYDDAAISSFTLGTLTQYTPGTSNVVATITGSDYKMVIDQINYRIENRDSLPLGTSLSSVTCTVTALNSGGVSIKNLTDNEFETFSSSTPIDFSQPRTFRVTSTDGSFTRDYTVNVNVKKTTDKTFGWKEKGTSTLLTGYSNLHMVAVGNLLFTFGKKNDALVICRSADGGVSWSEVTPNVATPFAVNAWENVVGKAGKIYLLSDGALYSSVDGEQWEQIAMQNSPDLKQLFGASTGELFALSNEGGIKASIDDGLNWNAEKISAPVSSQLPTAGLSCAKYQLNDSTDYVLMAGNDGTKGLVWRKISRYRNSDSGQWIYFAYETTNKNPLPYIPQLSLACYNGLLLAFGNGTTVYYTQDQGITWKTHSTFTLPAEMYSVVTDPQGRLWGISTDGKTWLGASF